MWVFRVAVPLAWSLTDSLSILEVIETDDFVVDRGELDAALVPGIVERGRWLGRNKWYKINKSSGKIVTVTYVFSCCSL